MISHIDIKRLYEIHDYSICFGKMEYLKIIHAPNGYGKTTLLRLVKAALKGEFEVIRQIPFKELRILCEDNSEVKVYKKQSQIIYTLNLNNEKQCYILDDKGESEEAIMLSSKLRQITDIMPIYMIGADRLWTEKTNYENKANSFYPTVLEYSKELGNMMRQSLAKSNYSAQELDRSFPYRLLEISQNDTAPELTEDKLYHELEELEKKRTILECAGLFHNINVVDLKQISKIDKSLIKVLQIYIDDSYKKLGIFEELSGKINLLIDIINKRFTHKKMEVDMNKGFIFKVPTGEELTADKLSSGEQNELILLFRLLFKSPQHAIILIDEPEISLHIAWQQSFLEDMEAVAKLINLKLIIATHSPDIINGRWDLTIGLEEC